MNIQKWNLLVSALCSGMMLQSDLPNMDTSGKKPGVHITGVSVADTKGTEPSGHITDRGVCITVKPP